MHALHSHGIASIMVEGGASVIQSFLSAGLVDLVLVTIAPIWLGRDAVRVTLPTPPSTPFHSHAWLPLGNDAVLAMRAA